MTEIQKQIGQKWFLTLEKLAKRSGVPYRTLQKIVRGVKVSSESESKLCEFLENYR